MNRRPLFACLLGFCALACSPSEAAGGGEGGAPRDAMGGSAGTGQTGGAGANGAGTGGDRGSGGSPSSAGSATTSGGNFTSIGGSPASGGAGGNRASGGNGDGKSGDGGTGGGFQVGGTAGRKSTPIAVKDLPIIEEMPDPLTMNDGTKVTTVEQWNIRRQEMIQILEDYEYGHMPPPPGNVKAAITTPLRRISVSGGLQADYRMLHLTFGPGEELGFDLGLYTPVTSTPAAETYPVLISLTFSATEKSLSDASAALSRGYAVATVPFQQLGADAENYASTAFFPAYPDHDWRDFSAWAWGLSRAVDYLVTDPAIDPSKIMITGVSRLGQAVLLAGAFDERIALSAPVAGGMAFRFSGKEMGGGLGQGITEIVDQNTYWFGPRFPEFRNKTPRLPSDQHWLPALTAPRLFILCNSLADQYGRAFAAAQTYLAAKPVYEFLGATANLGLSFRPGGHGMTAEDWSALLDFADQYLLKKAGTRTFDVLPPADQLP